MAQRTFEGTARDIQDRRGGGYSGQIRCPELDDDDIYFDGRDCNVKPQEGARVMFSVKDSTLRKHLRKQASQVEVTEVQNEVRLTARLSLALGTLAERSAERDASDSRARSRARSSQPMQSYVEACRFELTGCRFGARCWDQHHSDPPLDKSAIKQFNRVAVCDRRRAQNIIVEFRRSSPYLNNPSAWMVGRCQEVLRDVRDGGEDAASDVAVADVVPHETQGASSVDEEADRTLDVMNDAAPDVDGADVVPHDEETPYWGGPSVDEEADRTPGVMHAAVAEDDEEGERRQPRRRPPVEEFHTHDAATTSASPSTVGSRSSSGAAADVGQVPTPSRRPASPAPKPMPRKRAHTNPQPASGQPHAKREKREPGVVAEVDHGMIEPVDPTLEAVELSAQGALGAEAATEDAYFPTGDPGEDVPDGTATGVGHPMVAPSVLSPVKSEVAHEDGPDANRRVTCQIVENRLKEMGITSYHEFPDSVDGLEQFIQINLGYAHVSPQWCQAKGVLQGMKERQWVYIEEI